MSLNLNYLREQLNAEIDVFAVAKDEYQLDVDKKVESKEEVIERIVAEEYRLAFV